MLGIVLAVLLGLAGSDAPRADGGAPRLGFPSPPRFDAHADKRMDGRNVGRVERSGGDGAPHLKGATQLATRSPSRRSRRSSSAAA